MILNNLVKGLFSASRVAMNTVSLATPIVAKGIKITKDALVAEVVNAQTEFKDQSLEENKEMFSQSMEMSKMILKEENDMINKKEIPAYVGE